MASPMKHEKGTHARALDLFVKTFLPKKKKFTLHETQILAETINSARGSMDFNKVHELAVVFFPKKTELNEEEAKVLANLLLRGGLTKSKENKIMTLFKGSDYCTINQFIDVINNVKSDLESIFYGPCMTDGNGNSVDAYLLEERGDCRYTFGRDGIAQVLKDYNG